MILLSSKPRSPRTPLCVLCTFDGSAQQLSAVIDGLRLDSLLTAGLVSDYRVYILSPDIATGTSLSTVRVKYCIISTTLSPHVDIHAIWLLLDFSDLGPLYCGAILIALEALPVCLCILHGLYFAR